MRAYNGSGHYHLFLRRQQSVEVLSYSPRENGTLRTNTLQLGRTRDMQVGDQLIQGNVLLLLLDADNATLFRVPFPELLSATLASLEPGLASSFPPYEFAKVLGPHLYLESELRTVFYFARGFTFMNRSLPNQPAYHVKTRPAINVRFDEREQELLVVSYNSAEAVKFGSEFEAANQLICEFENPIMIQ